MMSLVGMVLCNRTGILRGHDTTVHKGTSFTDAKVFQFSAADFNPVHACGDRNLLHAFFIRVDCFLSCPSWNIHKVKSYA